ncbi:hypothetical protein VTK73DRAFT_9955 [Phialemonium thermophilum]|uniref:Ketoreductase domain-containing protein n=1 Tax=Phialemonium thermophilum TaxID=223376 RepID=A0ABR3XJ50_9PEZI
MVSKVIIVTGASRGIGLAVTNYLLNASHKVVLVSRSQKDLEAIKARFPSQVEFLAADLTNFDTAPKVTELALKAFGQLDGLVVNHGVLTPMQRVAESTIEAWKNIYDANLFSALALVKAAIPHLRASKGRVVFTSSGAALHAYASWGAYGSSKAALNSLAQHIAVEEPEIAVVSVGPGRVDTDMQKGLREKGTSMNPKEHADFVEAFKGGKLNKPEWPGQVIAKLAVEGKPDLAGRYLSWNSPELASYREQ